MIFMPTKGKRKVHAKRTLFIRYGMGGGPKIDISKVEKRVGTNFVKKKPDLLKGTRILLENDP